MRGFPLLFLSLLLIGCGPRIDVTAPSGGTSTGGSVASGIAAAVAGKPPAGDQSIEALKAEITHQQQIAIEAEAVRAAAEAKSADLEKLVAKKEAQARVQKAQWWCWALALASILGAIICGGLMFFTGPTKAETTGVVVCLGLASLFWFAGAIIVPYLLWFSIGIVVILSFVTWRVFKTGKGLSTGVQLVSNLADTVAGAETDAEVEAAKLANLQQQVKAGCGDLVARARKKLPQYREAVKAMTSAVGAVTEKLPAIR